MGTKVSCPGCLEVAVPFEQAPEIEGPDSVAASIRASVGVQRSGAVTALFEQYSKIACGTRVSRLIGATEGRLGSLHPTLRRELHAEAERSVCFSGDGHGVQVMPRRQSHRVARRASSAGIAGNCSERRADPGNGPRARAAGLWPITRIRRNLTPDIFFRS